jgi:hypothetical protein
MNAIPNSLNFTSPGWAIYYRASRSKPKYPQIPEDEMEFGGFMDSNRFGIAPWHIEDWGTLGWVAVSGRGEDDFCMFVHIGMVED